MHKARQDPVLSRHKSKGLKGHSYDNRKKREDSELRFIPAQEGEAAGTGVRT